MENNRYLKEYTLSDLFDSTFKMLTSTWKNSLIISLFCFVPMSLLSVLIMGKYFRIIVDFMQMGMNFQENSGNMIPNVTSMLQLLGPMFVYIGALVLVTGIANLIAKSVIALNTFRIIHGEQLKLKELMLIFLNKKLAKLLLQPLLNAAIATGIYIAGMIAIMITGAIFMTINPILGGFMIGIGVIALLCFYFWIFNSFSFIQEDVLYADSPVVASFKNSFALVQGNWWRVFGFQLLMGLTLSFGISILTGPIIFPMIMPMYADMMKELLSGSLNVNEMYSSMFSIYSKAQVPFFFSSLISSVLTFFIMPVFTAFFYIDLKVRKKEIGTEIDMPPDLPLHEGPDSGNETFPDDMLNHPDVTLLEKAPEEKAGTDGE